MRIDSGTTKKLDVTVDAISEFLQGRIDLAGRRDQVQPTARAGVRGGIRGGWTVARIACRIGIGAPPKTNDKKCILVFHLYFHVTNESGTASEAIPVPVAG